MIFIYNTVKINFLKELVEDQIDSDSQIIFKKSRGSFSYIEKDVFNKIDNELILQCFKKNEYNFNLCV